VRKIQGHEIAIGALVATAIWVSVLVLTSDAASHYEVCETTKEGAKECANYNVISFAFRKVGSSLDILGALITAIATVFIARFTFTLKQSTDRLWEAGEKQIGISSQMSDIASQQVQMTGLQVDIQEKQHEVGRLQFLVTHRPHLRIRHVTIETGARTKDSTFFFGHDATIEGYLVVVNSGGSAAEIIETRYRIFATKTGLPTEPPYDDDFRSDLLIVGQTLRVGESCINRISDTLIMPFDERLGRPTHQFENEGWSLYVMGQIRYKDQGRAERFMAFCRERKSDGRFRAIEDPDYEYED
jgi:hypothetical protein